MTNYNAVDLFSKNVQTPHAGNQVAVWGAVTPTAMLTTDKVRVCRIPAGFEAFRLNIKNADLDSNGTPTLAVKIGFEYEDGSGGTDNAFVASGSTIFQSASGVAGNNFLIKPITIDKPAFLTITPTANAATYAAGEIVGVLEGIGRGAK